MSFTANGINLGIPSGVIVASAAHTTDPDGYVIADGVTRTFDTKYNNLIVLGIEQRIPSIYLSYQFDGNVNDVTGNNLNGSLRGTANFDSSVFKRGSGSLISNTSSYVYMPQDLLGASGFTIAFWFYKTTNIDNSSSFFGSFSGANSSFTIFSQVNGAGHDIRIFFSTCTFASINVWNHFAMTLTSTSNGTSTLKMYANGVLQVTSTSIYNSYPNDYLYNNQIGKFDGYLDDFNIYRSVLTDSQISQILGYTPPNLKASFLRATGSQTVSSISYSGPTLENYQHNAIQVHTHPGSADAHTHGTASTAANTYDNTPGRIGLGTCNFYNTEATTNDDSSNQVNVFNLFDVTFNSAPVQSISVTNAGNDSVETAPFCYGVNWLIKL